MIKACQKNVDFDIRRGNIRIFRENQDFGISGLFSFSKCNSCLNSKAVNHFRIFNKKKLKNIFGKNIKKNEYHHEENEKKLQIAAL